MNRNKDHFIFLLTRELKNIKCIIRFIEMIILKIFYFKLPKIILINYKMLIEKQSIIYFRLSKEIK